MDSQDGPPMGQDRLAAFKEEREAALQSSATVAVGTLGPYSSVSLEPHRSEALSISWLASASEVVLSAGGGRWELEPQNRDLDLLEDIVRSVIAGRVSETRGRRWSRVEVTLADGAVEHSRVFDGVAGLLPGGRRQVEHRHFAAYR